MFDYDGVYWLVDNKKFFNRFEAALYSKQTNQKITFYMCEDAFDVYDWTVEPNEEWEDILYQRAMQVRDNFKYIRLWYSGGVDSHTMLLTFLKHNIFIDEILMKRDSPFDDFMFQSEDEINKVAIPFINTIKNQIPKTKITILDIGSKEYKQRFSSDQMFTESGILQFKSLISLELYRLVPSLLDSLKHTNSFCELRGDHKPRLFMENGKYYSAIYDSVTDHVGDINVELFYTTPNMPKVHIKQSHLVMKHLKIHYSDLKNKEVDALNKKNRELKQHINPSCRYPLWINISLGKGSGVLAWKQILILDQLKKVDYNLYDRYINIKNNQVSGYMEHFNNNDPSMGFVGILSKKYFLE